MAFQEGAFQFDGFQVAQEGRSGRIYWAEFTVLGALPVYPLLLSDDSRSEEEFEANATATGPVESESLSNDELIVEVETAARAGRIYWMSLFEGDRLPVNVSFDDNSMSNDNLTFDVEAPELITTLKDDESASEDEIAFSATYRRSFNTASTSNDDLTFVFIPLDTSVYEIEFDDFSNSDDELGRRPLVRSITLDSSSGSSELLRLRRLDDTFSPGDKSCDQVFSAGKEIKTDVFLPGDRCDSE